MRPRAVRRAIIAPGWREAWMLFGCGGGLLMALHGFTNKTNKTSADDLALGR